MNGGAKCRKWGGLGQLEGTHSHGHTTSYSTLIETMRLFCTVFDYSQLFVESRRFDPPHLHLAPPQGVIPVEIRGDLWHQKTRVPELSCVVCVILCLTVLVELRLVTDTDRRTQAHG